MRGFIFSTFLIFTISIYNIVFYPSIAKAEDNLAICNQLIGMLKSQGFNFQNFTNRKNMFVGSRGLMCGYPPNSDNSIMFMKNPGRAFVFNAMSVDNGYCVMFTSSPFKSHVDKC